MDTAQATKLEKLKARAWDTGLAIQRLQQQLQQINAEIAKESAGQPPVQVVPRAERRRSKG